MKTITEELLLKLIKAAGAPHVKQKEPMKLHTTMEVGGPAALFITPSSVEEIIAVMKIIREEGVMYDILGKGSNVICKDRGYQGVIIGLSDFFKGYQIQQRGNGYAMVSVKAGTSNQQFSDACISQGLSGFEFASGIPGSVGGAVAMNAGAYDGEMRQIVQRVRLLDPDGHIVSRSCEEMQFGYRHSLVTGTRYVILETVLKLKEADPEAIRLRVEDLRRQREEKQPLEYPSCGSTFKRPQGYFAGKLIADAGLKGYQLGGAQVSEKHAGFVINKDHATAADILNLIRYIQEKVYEQAGVKLECEVRILG